MDSRELIRRLEREGWRLVRTKGSHRQYKHRATRTGDVAPSEARSSQGNAPGNFQTGRMERDTMNYPVVLHKDRHSDYGVTVPDLPGCFSAGKTVDEALAMAKEAIELHLEGLIHEGQPIPRPGNIEQHRQRPEFRGGAWAMATIDPAGLRVRAKRLSITIPERILDAIDRFAAEHGQTRSGFLVEAAAERMGRAKASATGRAGRPAGRRAKATKGR